VTTRSPAPPLKSAKATSFAPNCAVSVWAGVAAAKVSVPAGLPRKVITVPAWVLGVFCEFTTATSSIASPLKLPIAILLERTPVLTASLVPKM
jgi:hypothetical protein